MAAQRWLKAQFRRWVVLRDDQVPRDFFSKAVTRGELRLLDIELRQEALRELLDLPPQLCLTRAHASVVVLRVPSWISRDKLRRVPTTLSIGELTLELAQPEELAAPRPKQAQPQSPKRKRAGMTQLLLQGIHVECASVALRLATLSGHVLRLDARGLRWAPADSRWSEVDALDESRVLSPGGGERLSFRLFTVASVGVHLEGGPALLAPVPLRLEATLREELAGGSGAWRTDGVQAVLRVAAPLEARFAAADVDAVLRALCAVRLGQARRREDHPDAASPPDPPGAGPAQQDDTDWLPQDDSTEPLSPSRRPAADFAALTFEGSRVAVRLAGVRLAAEGHGELACGALTVEAAAAALGGTLARVTVNVLAVEAHVGAELRLEALQGVVLPAAKSAVSAAVRGLRLASAERLAGRVAALRAAVDAAVVVEHAALCMASPGALPPLPLPPPTPTPTPADDKKASLLATVLDDSNWGLLDGVALHVEVSDVEATVPWGDVAVKVALARGALSNQRGEAAGDMLSLAAPMFPLAIVTLHAALSGSEVPAELAWPRCLFAWAQGAEVQLLGRGGEPVGVGRLRRLDATVSLQPALGDVPAQLTAAVHVAGVDLRASEPALALLSAVDSRAPAPAEAALPQLFLALLWVEDVTLHTVDFGSAWRPAGSFHIPAIEVAADNHREVLLVQVRAEAAGTAISTAGYGFAYSTAPAAKKKARPTLHALLALGAGFSDSESSGSDSGSVSGSDGSSSSGGSGGSGSEEEEEEDEEDEEEEDDDEDDDDEEEDQGQDEDAPREKKPRRWRRSLPSMRRGLRRSSSSNVSSDAGGSADPAEREPEPEPQPGDEKPQRRRFRLRRGSSKKNNLEPEENQPQRRRFRLRRGSSKKNNLEPEDEQKRRRFRLRRGSKRSPKSGGPAPATRDAAFLSDVARASGLSEADVRVVALSLDELADAAAAAAAASSALATPHKRSVSSFVRRKMNFSTPATPADPGTPPTPSRRRRRDRDRERDHEMAALRAELDEARARLQALAASEGKLVVTVAVGEQRLRVACGDGSRRVRWLQDAVAERFQRATGASTALPCTRLQTLQGDVLDVFDDVRDVCAHEEVLVGFVGADVGGPRTLDVASPAHVPPQQAAVTAAVSLPLALAVIANEAQRVWKPPHLQTWPAVALPVVPLAPVAPRAVALRCTADELGLRVLNQDALCFCLRLLGVEPCASPHRLLSGVLAARLCVADEPSVVLASLGGADDVLGDVFRASGASGARVRPMPAHLQASAPGSPRVSPLRRRLSGGAPGSPVAMGTPITPTASPAAAPDSPGLLDQLGLADWSMGPIEDWLFGSGSPSMQSASAATTTSTLISAVVSTAGGSGSGSGDSGSGSGEAGETQMAMLMKCTTCAKMVPLTDLQGHVC